MSIPLFSLLPQKAFRVVLISLVLFSAAALYSQEVLELKLRPRKLGETAKAETIEATERTAPELGTSELKILEAKEEIRKEEIPERAASGAEASEIETSEQQGGLAAGQKTNEAANEAAGQETDEAAGAQLTETQAQVGAASTEQSASAYKNRNFYYMLNMDLGFLLGFNGRGIVDGARKKVFLIEPVIQYGDLLRYGFSATANFGMLWPLGLHKLNGLKKPVDAPLSLRQNKRQIASRVASHVPSRVPSKLRSPKPKIPYKWSIGFQLRNMLSVGETSFIFNNERDALYKFYNQQDFRTFYAFQPVFYLSWMLLPTWELSLHLGPSFNWNFYQRTNEVFSWTRITARQEKKTERTTDSPWLSTFSLGAVMGFSFSHYFYSFLATGISTQFVLNLSPYDGSHSLGQFVFGLYVQFLF